MGDDLEPLEIAVDFDGSLVEALVPDDPLSVVQLQEGVYEGLLSLKRAGHTLLLYSARSNRALREDPYLDPLIRAGKKTLDLDRWTAYQPIAQARFEQMVEFVKQNLPDVFDAIDDGRQGKPSSDLFLDDKGKMMKIRDISKAWRKIARKYGR